MAQVSTIRAAVQRSAAAFLKTIFEMRKKREKAPTTQLCLFSETEMASMIEQINPLKPINLFTADPARIRWELEIGQSLRGKEGRQHRRLFTQRRCTVKIVSEKPTMLFYDS